MPFSYKPLFKLLVDKGMKKTELREAIGMGPSTLAKFEKGEYVSMEVIDRICAFLGCQIEDVVEHVKEQEG